jgi:rhodanese-related sulfurtransferase
MNQLKATWIVQNNLVYIILLLSFFSSLSANTKYTKIDFLTLSTYIGDGTRDESKPVIIDTRDLLSYKHSHIPSSKPIPSDMFDMFYYPTFAKYDKNKKVVLYGENKDDETTYLVYDLLKQHGHTDIKIYFNGLDEYKNKSYLEIYTSYARKYHKKNDAYFIDARKFIKYSNGTVVGARNITPKSLLNNQHFLPYDKRVKVIVFGSDYKSKEANKLAKLLFEIGYENTLVFGAGYGAWKRKGYESFKVINCQ